MNLSSRGYRFPAEWEPQEAIWFAWPTRKDLWSGRLERVLSKLVELYTVASRYQTVRVLCPKWAQPDLSTRLQSFASRGSIELFDYEVDDVWIRDYGPLFLLSEDGARAAISDWRFNAWGDKFPLQVKDNRATQWIAEQLGLDCFSTETVLEGGAIESNGSGRALTTEAVLLNPNRNGKTTHEEAETQLAQELGLHEVHWLKDGLVGDDTDGHIDNLARFYAPDGIIALDTDDASNPSHAVIKDNLSRLTSLVGPKGKACRIVKLPLPHTIYLDGEPLAASYMNYVLINGAVLVPSYQENDVEAAAFEVLARCFPDREIVAIDCSDIVREGGALHCMSQHQPRVGL